LKTHIVNAFNESTSMLSSFLNNSDNILKIEKAAKIIISTFKNGDAIYSCGNGGSMSDSIHFAEELTGRFRKDRAGLPATAICDPGHISCVANDLGYEYIFSRYLEAKARSGDCLLVISTSGTSKNIIKAIEYAKENNLTIISLTGRANSPAGGQTEVDIAVGYCESSDRIQELHIKVIHIIIELIERELFPENY